MNFQLCQGEEVSKSSHTQTHTQSAKLVKIVQSNYYGALEIDLKQTAHYKVLNLEEPLELPIRTERGLWPCCLGLVMYPTPNSVDRSGSLTRVGITGKPATRKGAIFIWITDGGKG